MSNRFFTILVIPEKTSNVRRFVIPSWIVKSSLVGLFFLTALGTIMILDYWFVMSQIGENKQLKIENRRLRQQVQIFKNKMITLENTMERIRTFSTRLRVITNIEDRSSLIQSLNEKLPDASTNIGTISARATAESQPTETDRIETEQSAVEPLLNSGNPESESEYDHVLRKDYETLDAKFSEMNHDALYLEQVLQDQYELLADQKSFLAALPTRKPTIGYFTSGFGIRKSPYGGREKMHEGLDIANHPGTPIKAPADGIVTFADGKPGYGQTVIIEHGYGLETWYAHCKKLMVKRNQKIRRGETIALLGSSGRSTGPHVHYEVRVNGIPVDPLSYLLEN